MRWAAQFSQRRWVVEGARGLGRHLAQWLGARDEVVVDSEHCDGAGAGALTREPPQDRRHRRRCGRERCSVAGRRGGPRGGPASRRVAIPSGDGPEGVAEGGRRLKGGGSAVRHARHGVGQRTMTRSPGEGVWPCDRSTTTTPADPPTISTDRAHPRRRSTDRLAAERNICGFRARGSY